MDQSCWERITSEEYADFILETNQIPESISSLPELCIDRINVNYSVAYMNIQNLPQNIIQTYAYSIFPKCYGLMDINSLEASGVSKIQSIPTLNLKGQGVLIGLIDTGIDYNHEAFKNADGTSRIISIWDQTIPSEEKPDGFYYGTEYTQEQINVAINSADPYSIVPSIDSNGHGTFLAGIAAGTPNETANFSGVVPNAAIVVVKLKQAKKFLRDFFFIPMDADCYQEIDIMFGVKYLLGIARKLARPISMCIGLGTSQGSHDSRSSLSNYLSSVADQVGVGVSIAAGNEGSSGAHYSGLVDMDLGYDTVELKVGPENAGFSMELWGDSPNLFSIDVLSPTGEYISRIPARLKETREITFIFEITKLFVDYEIVESRTGDELILIRFQNPTEGIWRFRVYSTINFEPEFHMWLPIKNFLSEGTSFVQPDNKYTLTSPGNSMIPVITTAYNYENDSLYIDASKGYTRENIINPTYATPGVNIMGPALESGYTTKSGTSISAAFSTGVVAMFLEWGIILGNKTTFDTLQIKNFLIRGAKRDPALTYPNQDWGYGILDVFNAFNTLRG